MQKIFAITLFFLLAAVSAWAQMENPTKWSFYVSDNNPQKGDEIELIFEATIDPVWYVYSVGFDDECGPIPTSFEFSENAGYSLKGKTKAVGDKEKYDDIFKCTIRIFKNKIQFVQKVKINDPNFTISGEIAFQACKDNGLCVYLDKQFELSPATPVKEAPGKKTIIDTPEKTEKQDTPPKSAVKDYSPNEKLVQKEQRRQNLKKKSEGDKKAMNTFIEKYGN